MPMTFITIDFAFYIRYTLKISHKGTIMLKNQEN